MRGKAWFWNRIAASNKLRDIHQCIEDFDCEFDDYSDDVRDDDIDSDSYYSTDVINNTGNDN
eukprot:Pgem_evm1s11660